MAYNLLWLFNVSTDFPAPKTNYLSNMVYMFFSPQFLDYEETNTYSLIIVATDGAPPDHSSTTNVTITIRDTNDNPPVFSLTEYVLQVPEGTSPGSPIGTVVATDSDGGDFGMVSYSLFTFKNTNIHVCNSTIRCAMNCHMLILPICAMFSSSLCVVLLIPQGIFTGT